MSFSSDNGYTPATISDLMSLVREGVNEQLGTSYDATTFVGTGLYKYYYALIQELQRNEVKTAEIVLKLQQYFDITNEIINRPKTTNPGLLDELTRAGFQASIKAPSDTDAGKVYVCVNLDSEAEDFAAKKLEVCEIIRDSTVAGVVSQGDQVETLAIANGQAFDFKFCLPDESPILLRLTLTVSSNNQFTILSDEDVKEKLKENIDARYKMGLDFEPQRYFSVLDAPWAASVLLEYSLNDGADWEDEIFEAEFDDLLTFALEDITVVTA